MQTDENGEKSVLINAITGAPSISLGGRGNSSEGL